MNVTKKEAEQICLWGEAIYNEENYLMICDDGQMVFDIYGGSDDTKLSYENEYKDYEWKLTDIKDLKQGDICKKNIVDLIPNMFIFDKNTWRKEDGMFWYIYNNRTFNRIIENNVYKLFKKEGEKK